jgi:hypothetical protein
MICCYLYIQVHLYNVLIITARWFCSSCRSNSIYTWVEMGSLTCSVQTSTNSQAAPFTVWNRRESHDCSDYPDFRVGAARTDTWHCLFSRDWKWRRHILCIQCKLYRALFWRVNRYISTYTYYMLFERQGWAKSTSKNVAKAYVNVQITANHYTLYYANN